MCVCVCFLRAIRSFSFFVFSHVCVCVCVCVSMFCLETSILYENEHNWAYENFFVRSFKVLGLSGKQVISVIDDHACVKEKNMSLCRYFDRLLRENSQISFPRSECLRLGCFVFLICNVRCRSRRRYSDDSYFSTSMILITFFDAHFLSQKNEGTRRRRKNN